MFYIYFLGLTMGTITLKATIIFLYVCISMSLEDELISCPNNLPCIPVSECRLRRSNSFIYPCHPNKNLICCPNDSKNTTILSNRKTIPFSTNCGIGTTSDKISGGKEAELGQFPWMALLGYKQKQVNFVQFLCAGTVITENHVLTAAHCINMDRRLEIVLVRLGEHDLSSEQDCISVDEDTKICAEKHVDIPIDHTIIHQNYNMQKLQNDIALVKVRHRIKFTDYVKPICLPLDKTHRKKDLSKQKLIVSGWGKTKAANLGGSNTLQFTSVTVWNETACETSVPPEVKPIRSSQLCANGASTEDACKGDSGGPLANATVDLEGELRYYQIGIVSFASTLTCGDPTLPTVYTRIDKYLQWISDNVS